MLGRWITNLFEAAQAIVGITLMSDLKIMIEEVTDPVETARFQEQMEQFRSNSNWLQAHWGELMPRARGKYLAVAGQEAFLADTPEEAWRLATTAHPDDKGIFSQFVIQEKGPRIYGHRG